MIGRPPRPPLFPTPPPSRPPADHLQDLPAHRAEDRPGPQIAAAHLGRDGQAQREPVRQGADHQGQQDRKSTRLNSSHLVISYAVFCLKKKKNNTSTIYPLLM